VFLKQLEHWGAGMAQCVSYGWASQKAVIRYCR
jgi:hypothetical protein